MYTKISFPFFGLEMDPGRYLDLFGFKIYYYGMIIALGLVLAFIYGMRRCKQFGIKQDDIVDGVLWIVPVAVICTRAYYVIFNWEAGGYAQDLWSIFSFRDGGLAIYGGVIGAAICVIFYCWKRKINLFAALDLVALGFLIGQIVLTIIFLITAVSLIILDASVGATSPLEYLIWLFLVLYQVFNAIILYRNWKYKEGKAISHP